MKKNEAQDEKVTITFTHENGDTLQLLFTRKADGGASISLERLNSDNLMEAEPLLQRIFATFVQAITEG